MASWRKEASHHLSGLFTPGILGIIVPTSMLSTWWRGGDCWDCWKMLKVDADCLYSKWLGDWGFQFWLSITPKWHDHMTELTISHFLTQTFVMGWNMLETCWNQDFPLFSKPVPACVPSKKTGPACPQRHFARRMKEPEELRREREEAFWKRWTQLPFGEDHGIEPPMAMGKVWI